MHRFRLIMVIGMVAVSVAVVGWRWNRQRALGRHGLDAARQALRDGRFDDAERRARLAATNPASAAEGWLIAAEAAAGAGRTADCLEHLTRREAARPGHQGLIESGEALLRFGLATEAESRFQQALRQGAAPRASQGLSQHLMIEGRHWEAHPHLFAQLRLAPSVAVLRRMAYPGRFVGPAADLERFHQIAPQDAGPLVGLALLNLREGNPARAKELLDEAIRHDSDSLEAQALLGWTLTQLPDGDQEMLTWHAGLPERATEHPLTWLALGMWCKSRYMQPESARCFWEAVRRDPNNSIANFQLGQVLTAIDRPDDAAPFHERAERLLALERAIESFSDDAPNADAVRHAAELTLSLGRPWEAWGWTSLLLSLEPNNAAARATLTRMEHDLTPDMPATLDEANPARQVDLSHDPIPRLESVPSATAPSALISTSDRAAIQFEDEAQSVGIDFQYLNGADPSTPGARMIETTGGGAAAWDFDQDGWPDIYLTQGGKWPPEPRLTGPLPSDSNASPPLDRLFRNLGIGRFDDVTTLAGLGDERFSQGVAAGDYDNDGFPDLYVANIGGNRLYHNQGDGTFRDVTDAAGLNDDSWTTSCLLADVNGDSIPDLFDVNYLEGHDVYDRICQAAGRPPRACSPRAFAGQPDRLWLGQGDGRFLEQSTALEAVAPDGNGLGIVAGIMDDTGQLALFVANDQTPNFLLINQSPRGETPRFVDEALPRGVALDREGRAQGCMGIAAEDLDGDGGLDLFVTNFIGEANNLYRAELAGRSFSDTSSMTGLAAPSHSMVGFGAQAIDADLDGWPDLLVTNGHVDNFSESQTPYRMRPQFFRNLAGRRFVEEPAGALGLFFDGVYLGRGLARLDWNRDGREDAIVSHMDAPAALLTNHTQGAGHFLALTARATTSARDAIGTIVRARIGDRVMTRQLTAGDGYQASNQRRLTFGLGTHEQVDQLIVHWPSGLEQSFTDLPADREWMLIEGDATPRPMAAQAFDP